MLRRSMPPDRCNVLRIGCGLERTTARVVLLALALLILLTPDAHALTYTFQGTLVPGRRCDRSEMPEQVVGTLRDGLHTHPFLGRLRLRAVDPINAEFSYSQIVRGRSIRRTHQIDACVLFSSPPPRRCAVAIAEMPVIPDASGTADNGAVILQFHSPSRPPDCEVRWEGTWVVLAPPG
jgi:hypothetical protein